MILDTGGCCKSRHNLYNRGESDGLASGGMGSGRKNRFIGFKLSTWSRTTENKIGTLGGEVSWKRKKVLLKN